MTSSIMRAAPFAGHINSVDAAAVEQIEFVIGPVAANRRR